jgi:hypothetical protein
MEEHCFLCVVRTKVFMRVYKISKEDYSLRHVYLSVCLAAWNNSVPSGQTFMKFDISIFFAYRENSSFIKI